MKKTRGAEVVAIAAALAMAGCVSAKIDYPFDGAKGRGMRAGEGIALKIIDLRYADKKSVASYAHDQGTYNMGVEFPQQLNDYVEIFGGSGAQKRVGARGRPSQAEEVRWYIAPDRLYWTPSGPIEGLGERLGEHLVHAGCFAAVSVEPPSTKAFAAGSGAKRPRLVLTIHRLLTLKERKPLADTIGFLGLSALSSSRELTVVDAEWSLKDAGGGEIKSGKIVFRSDVTGSSWRAKNKPFKMTNAAAKKIGDRLIGDLR